MLQLLGHLGIVGHSRHLEEIIVHVRRIDLSIRIVIARIVPPPSGRTLQFFAHHVEIAAIGHGPHAPTGDIDRDFIGSLGQSVVETLAIGLAHPTEGVHLRHEVQRAHAIFGLCRLAVPLLVDGGLQGGEMIGVGFTVGFRLGHTDIVHKDGELAHTEIVHTRVLVHDAIHHIGIFHETIARVDRPNEIHFRVLRCRRDFANHILCEQAVFHLLCRQCRGISGFPLLRMVDI